MVNTRRQRGKGGGGTRNAAQRGGAIPVPSQPTGLTASNITNTSFTLNWTAPAASEAVTSYVFKNGVTVLAATVSGTTATITGRTSSTVHSITMTAVNATGTSVASTAISVETAPDMITVSATAGTITPTGFTIQWPLGPPVVIGWYKFFVNGQPLAAPATVTIQSSVVIYGIFQNMPSNTSFNISLQVANTSNTAYSIMSNTLICKTLPAQPTGLTASNIKDTTLTLNWTAITGTEAITSYVFKNGGTVLTATVSGTTATVTGLAANTLYTITMTAANAAGISPASVATQAMTSPVLTNLFWPALSTAVTAQTHVNASVGSTTITLAFYLNNPTVSTVIINGSSYTPIKLATIGTNFFPWQITGLTPSTLYTITQLNLTNLYNTNILTVNVAVKTLPSPITLTPTVSNVTASGFTLKWYGGEGNTGFYFVYLNTTTGTVVTTASTPAAVTWFGNSITGDPVNGYTAISTTGFPNSKLSLGIVPINIGANGTTVQTTFNDPSKVINPVLIWFPPAAPVITGVGVGATLNVAWNSFATSGTITGYSFKDSLTGSTLTPTTTVVASSLGVLLTGFTLGSRCGVIVTVITAAGSTDSVPYIVNTIPIVPIVTVSNITGDGFTLNWQANTGATSYTYTCTNGTTGVAINLPTPTTTTATSATFAGLNVSPYWSSVITINNVRVNAFVTNYSVLSSASSSVAATIYLAPTPITQTGTTPIVTPTGYTFYWVSTGALLANVSITGTAGTPTTTGASPSFTSVFTGLTVGTSYSFTITAGNVNNTARTSATFTFSTPPTPITLSFVSEAITGTPLTAGAYSATFSFTGGTGAASYTVKNNGIAVPASSVILTGNTFTVSGLSFDNSITISGLSLAPPVVSNAVVYVPAPAVANISIGSYTVSGTSASVTAANNIVYIYNIYSITTNFTLTNTATGTSITSAATTFNNFGGVNNDTTGSFTVSTNTFTGLTPATNYTVVLNVTYTYFRGTITLTGFNGTSTQANRVGSLGLATSMTSHSSPFPFTSAPYPPTAPTALTFSNKTNNGFNLSWTGATTATSYFYTCAVFAYPNNIALTTQTTSLNAGINAVIANPAINLTTSTAFTNLMGFVSYNVIPSLTWVPSSQGGAYTYPPTPAGVYNGVGTLQLSAAQFALPAIVTAFSLTPSSTAINPTSFTTLLPNLIYAISILASNTGGNAPYSGVYIVATGSSAPTIGTITTTSSIGVASNSCTVSITPAVGTTSFSYTIDGFAITPTEVKTTATAYLPNASNNYALTTYYTSLTATFTGIVPGTHTLVIRANSGPGSVSALPYTLIFAPDKPVLAQANVTYNQFSVTWTGGTGATSYIYTIGGQPVTPASTGTNSATFTGLAATTSYTVTVTAANSAGSSPVSTALTVTTLVAPPTAPVLLPFTNIGGYGFTANWSGAVGATSYTYSVNGVAATPTSTSTNSATFGGYSLGAVLPVIITATNAGGSVSSSAATVTLLTLTQVQASSAVQQSASSAQQQSASSAQQQGDSSARQQGDSSAVQQGVSSAVQQVASSAMQQVASSAVQQRDSSAVQQRDSSAVQQGVSSAVQQVASSAMQQVASSAVQQRDSSAVQQRDSSSVQQGDSSAVQQRDSSAVQQFASSAIQQVASSAMQQVASSAVQQRDSSAVQQRDSSAVQQDVSSAVQQRDSSAVQQGVSSAVQQRDSSAVQQTASSAQQQTASSAQQQTASSAQQQTTSSAQQQHDSSAVQQTVSSAQQQDVSSAQQQTVSSAQQQTVSSAVQQTVSSAVQQTASSAQQQTVSSAQQQTASSAQQQTASSAQQQTVSSAVQQTASSAQQQHDSSAVQQTVSSAQEQTASSAQQQTVSSAQQQHDSSAVQQTVSSAQQQGVSSAVQQTASSAQQQTASSAQQQGVSSAQQQTASSAQQQTASSAQQQGVSSAQQQTVSSAQEQTVSSAQQQTVSSAQQQGVSSAQQQTASSAQQQTASSAQQQTVSSAQQQKASSAQEQDFSAELSIHQNLFNQYNTLKDKAAAMNKIVYSASTTLADRTAAQRELMATMVQIAAKKTEIFAEDARIRALNARYQDRDMQPIVPDPAVEAQGYTKRFDMENNKYIYIDSSGSTLRNSNAAFLYTRRTGGGGQKGNKTRRTVLPQISTK